MGWGTQLNSTSQQTKSSYSSTVSSQDVLCSQSHQTVSANTISASSSSSSSSNGGKSKSATGGLSSIFDHPYPFLGAAAAAASSMLSPPLSANPFSSFDWMSSSGLPSLPKISSEKRTNNSTIASDKSKLSSCRYGLNFSSHPSTTSTSTSARKSTKTPDFLSMFSAEAVAMANRLNSGSASSAYGASTSGGGDTSSTRSTTPHSSLYSPHFSSPSSASYHAAIAAQSPTIYPPTPPPSAPWPHGYPWYPGDTF